MKNVVLVFFTLIFGFANAQFAEPCDEIPKLNQAVIDALTPHIGKKIDRGECWDAASFALNEVDADWDGLYVFGKVINPKKECIQPGDILQFEKVRLEVKDKNGSYVEKMPHHTAIVYAVKGPGELELLHQNTGTYGKVMGITLINLKYVTKGTITVYRPVPKTQ